MRVGFLARPSVSHWGGDLAALHSLVGGLRQIGHEAVIASSLRDLTHLDFIFLVNASPELKGECEQMRIKGIPYGVIGFHDNRSRHYSHGCGFVHCVMECLASNDHNRLEQLLINPESVALFSYTPPVIEGAFDFLEDAKICIATSPTEAETMRQDFPTCPIEVLYLESGISDVEVHDKKPSFLNWTGLKEGEYVLQVGRIEMRKNQLASLLAMRDAPMPLVFIATRGFNDAYEKIFLEAVHKWRRAPTLLISQVLDDQQLGNLQILGMPEKQKLSREMLLSAYQHAGLHLHPAFCELPGLTYLETAKLGIPTVASTWATIKDYFMDPSTGKYSLDDRIAYALPYHIPMIEEQIQRQFGKKIDKNSVHPAFQRTQKDVATKLIEILVKS